MEVGLAPVQGNPADVLEIGEAQLRIEVQFDLAAVGKNGMPDVALGLVALVVGRNPALQPAEVAGRR